MKRKILSLVLVAAMLVSMVIFAPTAGAETQAAVSTTNAVGVVGDTVTVDVNVSVDSFAGFQLAFVYDSSRLTYNGVSYDQTGSSFSPAGAAQNQQFVQYGPYTLIGRAWQDAEGKTFLFKDCADMKFATLSFTIKEDAPLGDAYVEFCTLRGEYNDVAYTYDQISRSAALGSTTNITYTGSVVTVLPADYKAALDLTDADWDFDPEYGTIYGIIREDAMDYTGTIVIPSEIGGVAVAEIAASAFEGYMASAVVVPESVSYISLGAFYNCSSLTAAYILNPNAEIVGKAFGYAGAWRTPGVAMRNPAVIQNEAGTASLITIYGAAGSAVEEYATSDGLQFAESAGLYTLSFNGSSYLVGANTVVPGTAIVDGKLAVAWTDGDDADANTYAAGSAITLTGDLALKPVTITAPQTSTSVDFKLTAEEKDLAMRFTSTLTKEDYKALAGLGTVELGMLITPAAYVAKAGSFTKEALDAIGAKNGGYVDIAIDGYYMETADEYILAGSLKGFSAATLAKNPDFAAIAYATVTTEGGDVFTIYGDFNFDANQDVKSIAETLSTSDKLMDTQKGWLANLVTKFGA